MYLHIFFSDYSEPPVIYYVSSDQKLNIYSGYDKVHLVCEATGENITGGYWEKVGGGHLSPSHNKSKPLSYSNGGKAVKLKLVIIKAHPIHSGRYRCIVYGQWGVTKSRKVNVIIKSKSSLSCITMILHDTDSLI